jgi:hypothetical protein
MGIVRDLTINIILTRQEVNMGDHAETVWDAVAPIPGETVEELVKRTLTDRTWSSSVERVRPSTSLTIRVAEAPDPEEAS